MWTRTCTVLLDQLLARCLDFFDSLDFLAFLYSGSFWRFNHWLMCRRTNQSEIFFIERLRSTELNKLSARNKCSDLDCRCKIRSTFLSSIPLTGGMYLKTDDFFLTIRRKFLKVTQFNTRKMRSKTAETRGKCHIWTSISLCRDIRGDLTFPATKFSDFWICQR